MTKEELKALGLTDEQVAKVAEDYGRNYVSKTQFNAKNEELKALKAEQENVKGEIETLRKSNQDNAALTKQIDDLKAAQKTREKEYGEKVKQLQINGIVERALLAAKAKNPKAVRALLTLDQAELDGDRVKGLDEQIKALQTSDAYLFEDESKPKVAGFTPKGSADTAGPQGELTVEQQFANALNGVM